MVEEGWYTDPNDESRLRYWEGTRWTEHTQDRPPEIPEEVDPSEPDERLIETLEFDDSTVSEESPTGEAHTEDAPPEPPPNPSEPEPMVEPEPVAVESVVEPSVSWTEPEPVAVDSVVEPSLDPPAAVPAPLPAEPPPEPPLPSAPTPPPPSPPPPPAPRPPSPPPPPPPSAPPPSAQLPTAPVPAEAPEPEPDPDLALPIAEPGHLNNVAQWLQRTFRVGLSKLLPCSVLIVIGLVPAVFFYAVMFLTLSDVSVDSSGSVDGLSGAMIFILGLLLLAWMLWSGVVTLAQNHLLYQAHVGRPTSIGQSMQAGLQGLGRFVWAYLALVAYAIVVVGVVGGLTFVFSLVSAALGSVFFVVAYLAALLLSVWLGVKLVFLLVASAVAPRGEGPMGVSVDTTDGYFWAILGRVLLLALIVMVVVIPVTLVSGGVFALLGEGFFEPTDTGSAVPLLITGLIAGVLSFVLMLAVQVISTSGIVRLYVDLGGPAQIDAAPAQTGTAPVGV